MHTGILMSSLSMAAPPSMIMSIAITVIALTTLFILFLFVIKDHFAFSKSQLRNAPLDKHSSA